KRTSSRSAAFSCSRRIFAQASSSSAGRLGRPGRRPRGTFSVTTPRGSSTSTSRSPAPVASGAAAPVFASVAIFEPSCKGVERRRGRGTAAARGAYRLAVRTRKLPLPAGRRKFRDPLPRVRGGWKRQKGRASVMRVRILASGLALLLAACGRGPAPAAPTPAAVAEPDTVRRDIRWAARPVPVPPSFQRAVDEGTRTLDGRPGPAYWQQRVVYRIDAELDPGTGRLQAEERVTYHNRSPDTLHVVVFNLYQNLFRAGAPRNEPVPVTDGLVLERFAIAGAEADPIDIDAEAPPDRATYHLDGTLLVAHLPRPLAPGDSAEFQVAWDFTVPPADAPRPGRSDHRVHQGAPRDPHNPLDGAPRRCAAHRPQRPRGLSSRTVVTADRRVRRPPRLERGPLPRHGGVLPRVRRLRRRDHRAGGLARRGDGHAREPGRGTDGHGARPAGPRAAQRLGRPGRQRGRPRRRQRHAARARRPAHLAVPGARRARLRVRRVRPLRLGRDARRDRGRRGRPPGHRRGPRVLPSQRDRVAQRRALHPPRAHVHGGDRPSVHLPANHGDGGAGLRDGVPDDRVRRGHRESGPALHGDRARG